ncbi:MAG: hypothetical protein IPO21_19765 [Bacteroidales bacterium]|nr:hypothetical protein [Bacteroidales bacterium]
MRIFIKNVLIVSVFLLAVSCGRTIDCPNFDKQILEWLPYKDNQIIYFKNFESDSVIELNIKKIVVEHTSHYSTKYDCGTCNDLIEINSYSNDSEENLYVNIYLQENKIVSEDYTIMGSSFYEYYSIYSEESNYDFNGVIYENVKIFDNSENGTFYIKLIIAKGFGIVGFIDKHGNNWILNKAEDKEPYLQMINIQNVPCG